ncbi:RyR domain-containing protein [Streptomyces specialis]|uniref:RyR domain-containing protein n=1 Tax=Streptomyces specialis TaxID=498367 RepID=UPI00073EC9F7|nr:RyR domain-containing protein [Streptomyces specialis]
MGDDGDDRPAYVLTAARLCFGALTVLALVLGYAGLSTHLDGRTAFQHGPFDILYYDLQLFVLSSTPLEGREPVPWTLRVAMFAAPAVTVYALFEAGRLLFAAEWRRVRTRRLSRHAIVCGDDAASLILADRLRARGLRVVRVGQRPQAADAGLTTVRGDPQDARSLRAAGIEGASTLYVCGQDSARNIAVALAATRARHRSPADLRVFVRVNDPDLCMAFRARRWSQAAAPGPAVDFFSPDELAARVLLRHHRPVPEGVSSPDVVVSGLTAFGRGVLVETARQWRAAGGPPARRIRLTVLDPDARGVLRDLTARYAFLADTCALTVHDGDLARLLRERADRGQPPPDRVYICQEDNEAALRTALTTTRLWHGGRRSVVVRLDGLDGVGEAFGNAADGGRLLDAVGERLHMAGVADLAHDPGVIDEDLTEIVARALHERYVRARAAEGGDPAGTPSTVPWHELSPVLKEANRRQARDIGAKLRTIGCSLALRDETTAAFQYREAEIERLSEHEHRRWTAERVAAGWTHGERRDGAARRHPDLVPWERLAEDAREKDRQAVRDIPGLLADVGLGIVRLDG